MGLEDYSESSGRGTVTELCMIDCFILDYRVKSKTFLHAG